MTYEERLEAIRAVINEAGIVSISCFSHGFANRWSRANVALEQMEAELAEFTRTIPDEPAPEAPEAPQVRRTRFSMKMLSASNESAERAEEGLNQHQIEQVTKLVEDLIVEHIDFKCMTDVPWRAGDL